MAGLSAARNTPRRTGEFGVIGVEANTSIYLGSLVMIDGSGYAVPGQVLGAGALASLRMFGVAKAVLYNSYPGQNAINTSASIKPGGATPAGNAGDFQLECYRKGVFGFDFDSSITAAAPQIGMLAFANDDHTVSVLDGSGGTTVPNTTSITVPASGLLINVLKPYIVPGTFNAYSATGGGGTHYVENTDFAVDYQSGLFITLAGGAISAGGTVYVTYKYGLPTKVPVGTIVAVEGNQCFIDIDRLTNPSANEAPLAGN